MFDVLFIKIEKVVEGYGWYSLGFGDWSFCICWWLRKEVLEIFRYILKVKVVDRVGSIVMEVRDVIDIVLCGCVEK